MTKEEFNKQVNVGDIVMIYGVENKIVPCVVMNKTEYACNLLTVEQAEGDDGVIHANSSYYRSYDEIISRVGDARGLYNYYKTLHDQAYAKFEEDEEYEAWVQENDSFLQHLSRFLKENLKVNIEKESDYYGSESYDATVDVYTPQELQK